MCRSSDLSFLTAENDSRRDQTVGQYHLRAFVSAAFIYFYQTFYELPPSNLEGYVSEVLHNLKLYTASGGASFTFWPAFIAATETYKDEDKDTIKHVFADASASSMQNRAKIKGLVEEVWRLRDLRATERDLERGMIKVDWRMVMQDLELDILLM